MALNFYRQRDIDAMDIHDIPEEFVNYFESLEDDRKVALVGSRPDLAEALGFVIPENKAEDNNSGMSDSEQEIPEAESPDMDSESGEKDQRIQEASGIAEDNTDTDVESEENEFARISRNKYENIDLCAYIVDDQPLPEIEALAIRDDVEKCVIHRSPFVEKQIKYRTKTGSVYGMKLKICPQCHRIFIKDSVIEQHHKALMDRNIPHTFYSLELTNSYLRSQMPPREFSEKEVLYIPDTWIEEAPVCPIHDADLYPVSCFKQYKGRHISFTGYCCDFCNKIMVRRAVARNLEDECGRLGITQIRYEPLRKKAPVKKPVPPRKISSDFIIEDGKREPYRRVLTKACYQLTEEDTVIVSDSIYCGLDGHNTEEVPALIWVDQKKGGRKAYLFGLGYCADCQKYHMDIVDYRALYSYGRPEITLIRDIDDADYQITSGEVFNLERKHLDNVETLIDTEVSIIKSQKDYVSQYATGFYDDGNLSFAKYTSKNKYEKRLDELTAYTSKPYSYRVDITADGKTETYYIGAAEVILNGKTKVISANSQFGHDLINYQTITVKKGNKNYNIKLTRQFDIDNAHLYGYVNLRTDEDIIFRSGITDPFLVRVLNMRKRQHNLTDIFVTIQENQNRIVNSEFRKNIIVQGCAGSGKTMVLLHRLSSLSYKERNFDFSNNALILTPNHQFTLHIKGLAEELQIGSIPRISVERYYFDTLLSYSQEFDVSGSITSEMIVSQDFVNYIYSDKFRSDLSAAYSMIIAQRNSLAETLNDLTTAMGQPVRKIDFTDDSKVVRQMRFGVDAMQNLVERKESEIAAAIDDQEKIEARKQYMKERSDSLLESSKSIVRDSLPQVYTKIGTYLSGRQHIITELKDQLQTLRYEHKSVQLQFFMIGKQARLEELNKKIRSIEKNLSKENRRQEEELPVLSAVTTDLTEDELLAWMRQVMLIIPEVQEEVRFCNNMQQQYQRTVEELKDINLRAEIAARKVEELKADRYSDEIKRAIAYLYTELDKYTIPKTYKLVFDQAVSEYKSVHSINHIPGKIHRYDLYAMILFAMKYFNRNIGTVQFMCIDEGQDLAMNEYRLLYELNQYRLVLNIFGDTNQLMKEGRGISDWTDLKNSFRADKFTLNENYRNTNQITRFCNSSFNMNVTQTGVDGPNVREIPRRDLENELAAINIKNERIAILVPRDVKKGSYIDKDLLPRSISEIIGDRIENGYISLMYVDDVKGIEFDKAYVDGHKMSRNEKYIAYTRALSELILIVDDNVKEYDETTFAEKDLKTANTVKYRKVSMGRGVLDYVGDSANQQQTGNNEPLPFADDRKDAVVSTLDLEETINDTAEKSSEKNINMGGKKNVSSNITGNKKQSTKDKGQEHLVIKVINQKGKMYDLIPCTGKFKKQISRKADAMLLSSGRSDEDCIISVSVIPKDRAVYIDKNDFENNRHWITSEEGVELRNLPFAFHF